MENVIRRFRLEGTPVSVERYGSGHINRTWLVRTDAGRRYILQRLNRTVFADPAAVMENVAAVCAFLAGRTGGERRCLRLAPALDGTLYVRDEDGEFWRVYGFVEGCVCLEAPETPEDLYQSAAAFGTFQSRLADLPAGTLRETIPRFHDTPDRYRQLRAAVGADAAGRAAGAGPEIAFALAREEAAGALQRMRQTGALPVRVAHNDTKLNNVLLDAATRRAVCVVDLDTVMPGLAAYDFGDAVRFAGATAAEDERDLEKMGLSLEAFDLIARGYLDACPGLTDRERETLPLGAWTMTLECGVRFLTDYLQGDTYFAVHRPGHNLDRARAQFRLAEDMERKWDAMTAVMARLGG